MPAGVRGGHDEGGDVRAVRRARDRAVLACRQGAVPCQHVVVVGDGGDRASADPAAGHDRRSGFRCGRLRVGRRGAAGTRVPPGRNGGALVAGRNDGASRRVIHPASLCKAGVSCPRPASPQGVGAGSGALRRSALLRQAVDRQSGSPARWRSGVRSAVLGAFMGHAGVGAGTAGHLHPVGRAHPERYRVARASVPGPCQRSLVRDVEHPGADTPAVPLPRVAARRPRAGQGDPPVGAGSFAARAFRRGSGRPVPAGAAHRRCRDPRPEPVWGAVGGRHGGDLDLGRRRCGERCAGARHAGAGVPVRRESAGSAPGCHPRRGYADPEPADGAELFRLPRPGPRGVRGLAAPGWAAGSGAAHRDPGNRPDRRVLRVSRDRTARAAEPQPSVARR